MSLRARIALLVGVTVLIATAIAGIGTAISTRNVGRDRLDKELTADASLFSSGPQQVAARLQFAFEVRRATCSDEIEELDNTQGDGTEPVADSGNRPGRQNPLNPNDGGGNGDNSGVVLPRNGRPVVIPEFAAAMQRISPEGRATSACLTLPISERDAEIAATGVGTSFRTISIEGERFRMLTEGYGDLGAVQFARGLALTEDTMNGILGRIVFFGLIGAVLAAGLGWVFAKRATLPVQRLSATAQRVARTRDLGERIDLERDDEIGVLASSLNEMLASLDTSREQQQRLVQDASHELRTPLTSMRTNVEMLLRHDTLDAETRARILSDINTELAELSELTAELVESATEVATTPDAATPVVLAELVGECVDRARRRHRREFTLDTLDPGDGPSAVLGDPVLLSRAVTNLINNAAKFSEPPAPIEISVSGGSVTVHDRGAGIPEADLPHIFERFYRATAARSAPGSGLGLAIVHQIVTGHGGHVTAANRVGGGTSIGFVLPVSPAQPD